MKKINIKYLIAFVVVICLVFGVQAVPAESPVYANLDAAGSALKTNADLFSIISNIVNAVLGLLGVAMVIIMIYAGIIWGFLARGEKTQIDKARQMIINAVIGLAIVFASYLVSSFLIDSISKSGSGKQSAAIMSEFLLV